MLENPRLINRRFRYTAAHSPGRIRTASRLRGAARATARDNYAGGLREGGHCISGWLPAASASALPPARRSQRRPEFACAALARNIFVV